MLLLAAIVLGKVQAQTIVKNKLLDVYQIDFAHYAEKQEGINYTPEYLEAYETSQRLITAGKLPFTIYAHADYGYQVERSIDTTIGIMQYRADKFMRIHGKTALMLGFKDLSGHDFYYASEAITDSNKVYAVITLTDDTMTVAGYSCRLAVVSYSSTAVRYGDTKMDMELWYAPGLPAFYGSGFDYLQKIPGAALFIVYDTGQNIRLGYKAKTVLKQKKPLSFFELPEGTEIIYPVKGPPMR